ncbi:uncharacterized protein TNCV_3765311 [Trichonephila clavipes]|nr:uncharacterized protein TNCV_3765311 [Trichonephila clavipes]
MILLRQSQERNKAPTKGEALEAGPVDPCLTTSLRETIFSIIVRGGKITRAGPAVAQRYQANGSRCEAMAVLTCPKPIPRFEPQILDYVEVRNPQTTSNLLQIIDKYEERFLNGKIRGSSWEFRNIQPTENNRFPNRNRQENWRETRGNNRYSDNSRPRREFNRFESQGVMDNQRFDGRRRGGQSDHGFHNQGG